MATQCILPTEIVCRILRYSCPRDIGRWRAVSKWFHAITYDASIWRYLYANSCLPRPPGPFSTQSTAYLEQALVRTERLARSWTTKPMRDMWHVEFQAEQPIDPIKLFGGRWLVGCELSIRFILHDVDANPKPRKHVIWEEEEEEALVCTWDACSVTSEEGQCLVYVVFNHEHLGIPYWRLLELRMNDKSDKLYDLTIFDIHASDLGLEVSLASGGSPFLYIPVENLVFDTRTQKFYHFPEFRVVLEETRYQIESISDIHQEDPKVIVLTNTHVISLYRYSSSSEVPLTVIQAFILPPGGSSVRNGVLRLSHEGVSDHHFHDVTLLRNTIIDPVTGTAIVRLLEFNRHQLHAIDDLTLFESSSDDVLPITIAVDEKIRESKLHEHSLQTCPDYVDCSDDGHLRGFFMKNSRDHSKFPPIMNFTIDATRDKYTLATGELLLPEWNHVEDPGYIVELYFDGARGRLCFGKGIGQDRVWQVVVIDLE